MSRQITTRAALTSTPIGTVVTDRDGATLNKTDEGWHMRPHAGATIAMTNGGTAPFVGILFQEDELMENYPESSTPRFLPLTIIEQDDDPEEGEDASTGWSCNDCGIETPKWEQLCDPCRQKFHSQCKSCDATIDKGEELCVTCGDAAE